MSLDRPLRGGLIGCGYVAQHHMNAWRESPDARIVALCDVSQERLDWATTLAPGANGYASAEDMFRAEGLDFVEICTRPDSHRALTELAASHGCHVLCQKPAALERDDMVAMIDACDAANVRLMIHENWRYRHWYRAIREELDAGTVGRPIRLRIAHRDTRALVPGGFGGQPYCAEMPRLMLIEMGCHLIDPARHILGDVQDVFATLGRFGPTNVGEDLATLSLRFRNGALGLLDISWVSPADTYRPEWALNETVLEGTEATLRLRTDGHLDLIRLDGSTEIRPVPLPSPDRIYLEGYTLTQAHFLAGILNDIPHESSGRDNLKTMDVVWLGYQSAAEGRRLDLPK